MRGKCVLCFLTAIVALTGFAQAQSRVETIHTLANGNYVHVWFSNSEISGAASAWQEVNNNIVQSHLYATYYTSGALIHSVYVEGILPEGSLTGNVGSGMTLNVQTRDLIALTILVCESSPEVLYHCWDGNPDEDGGPIYLKFRNDKLEYRSEVGHSVTKYLGGAMTLESTGTSTACHADARGMIFGKTLPLVGSQQDSIIGQHKSTTMNITRRLSPGR